MFLVKKFRENRIFIPGFLLMGIERTLAGWQASCIMKKDFLVEEI
jgi:hypothetical protein